MDIVAWKLEERRGRERSYKSEAIRWLTKTCANGYKSARTLMESGSDTIILSEKIDARDVCKSSDATPSLERIGKDLGDRRVYDSI